MNGYVHANGARILIVDDDPDLTRALSRRLTHQGYEVRCAYDGVQAMTEVRKNRPHLILLDLHLPAGDGFRIRERLLQGQETSRIPVIAITADPSPDVERKCLELGCAGFFRKPYDSHRLLHAMERALALPGDEEETTGLARAA